MLDGRGEGGGSYGGSQDPGYGGGDYGGGSDAAGGGDSRPSRDMDDEIPF